MLTTRRLALAIALTLTGSAAQALNLNNNYDGLWHNPADNGRGLVVDVVANASGATFFGALFTYDTAGNPLWLTIQQNFAAGQSSATGVPVSRFNGGSFGSPFMGPTPPTGTLVGTATVTVNSCNSMTVSITPNAASNGLPATTLNYVPFLADPQCVETAPFTSCPAGTTAVAGQTATCALAGTLAGDMRLANNATYVINGKVQVGTPIGAATQVPANLTIDAGTVLRGGGGTSDYLVVNPSSKIFANGTASAPIIFDGPTDTPGSWAGVFIAGRAPVNKAATAGGTIAFEADANIIFGGSDVNDSSGVMRYVQIRNAGQTIAPNRELNSLTLGGVGAGTLIDYVQAHNGTDDGFEWFGGTVNAKHLVATGNDDDNLDFDFGYRGRIQYAYVRQDAAGLDTADGRGVESDNQDSTGNFDALPRTQPLIANLTMIGGGGIEGMRLRRGSSGRYFHTVIGGNFTSSCLRLNDAATYNAIAPTPTTISGSHVACATNFRDDSAVTSPPITVAAWYAAGANNTSGTDINTVLDGRFPRAGQLSAPALSTGDSFFDATTYKGAFSSSSDDWAAGWTVPGSL
ncbi:MAG: hypothetical protein ABIP49_00155 [Lysobacterales bacterium]